MSVNTPANEPYIGRESLFHYDKMLVQCFDAFKVMPRLSRKNPKETEALTEHQKMAIQVISQSLNLAASIRELIRQGYLFGALVLERSFVERMMILLYLHEKPDEIKVWNEGWSADYRLDKSLRAPSLATMIKKVGKGQFKGITKSYNDLVHGKPESWMHGLIIGENECYDSPSKTNNNTQDCDRLCFTIVSFLVVLLAMVEHYFPKDKSNV